MKKEKFPPTRKPLHWWRQQVGRAVGGSFGAMEDSTATGMQGAKQTDSCTEDQC